MDFDPLPGDRLRLDGVLYQFACHPENSSICHGCTGAKATVYRLISRQSSSIALKVFQPETRNVSSHLLVERLRGDVRRRGLAVANRTILAPQHPLVRQYPDLEAAVIMPWISGATCSEVFQQHADSATTQIVALEEALHCAADLLGILSAMERAGYAHTDISSGNIILSAPWRDVELIDLEDCFQERQLPGLSAAGTDPYCHPSGCDTWCAEGDRYAAALVAAELLLLANPSLVSEFTEDGYFRRKLGISPRSTPEERYAVAQGWLATVCMEFGRVFAAAWESSSLQDSPSVSELSQALQSDMARWRTSFRGRVKKCVWRKSVDPKDFSHEELETLSPLVRHEAVRDLIRICQDVGASERGPRVAADLLDTLRFQNEDVVEEAELALLADAESLQWCRRALAAEVRLKRRLRQLRLRGGAQSIDVSFVTCAEYQLFLEESAEMVHPPHWKTYGFQPGRALLPIDGVTAEQALMFCRWLSEREGGDVYYRLPTIEEVRAAPSDDDSLGCWSESDGDFRLGGLSPRMARKYLGRLWLAGELPLASVDGVREVCLGDSLDDLVTGTHDWAVHYAISDCETLWEISPLSSTESTSALVRQIYGQRLDKVLLELRRLIQRGDWGELWEAVETREEARVAYVASGIGGSGVVRALLTLVVDIVRVLAVDEADDEALWAAVLRCTAGLLLVIYEVWNAAYDSRPIPAEVANAYWSLIATVSRSEGSLPCWEGIRIVCTLIS